MTQRSSYEHRRKGTSDPCGDGGKNRTESYKLETVEDNERSEEGEDGKEAEGSLQQEFWVHRYRKEKNHRIFSETIHSSVVRS